MKFGLQIDLEVGGAGDLEASVDRVVEEFSKLELLTPGLIDMSIGLDLAENHVDVEMTVQADTVDGAVSLGVSSLRAAIHATGASTPNWDDAPFDESIVRFILDETGLQARPLVDA